MTVALALIGLFFSAVALVVSALLWSKLREVHRHRRHDVALISSLNQQLTSLSRAAARSEVRASVEGPGASVELTAQHGEEFFLWELCGFKRDGIFVEIGAYNGVSLSNTSFFEQLGWRGILVEAHPQLVEECRRSRPHAIVVHAALGSRDSGEVEFSMVCGERGLDTLSFATTSVRQKERISRKGGEIKTVSVPARTLASLLGENGLTSVDIVTIDVEGAELEVLKGAGLDSVKPKLLLIEDNSGGSDTLIADYLRRHDYRRVITIGCNDVYEYSP